MAIITRDVGSFESNKGLIAGKQYSLDGPGEGEVFLLTSDIDSAYGTSPYSYQMGYIKDGKLQYFDMREKLREMDKNVVDVYRGLGWDDRMSKLGQFDGDGIFSVKEGGLYGTKTMDINGQQVTLNAYRAGEGPGQSVMTKYEFVYPDGTTVNKKTKTGLTHSSMRSFLNQAVVKTFSPEYQNLKLGYGEMATSKNGPVMKNLQVLSKQYGGVDTGTLNTYSKQELESFYGAGTATNNFNAIDTQYQAYTQTPEYQQTQPGFIKQTETKVGEGAGSYQDIKDQPTVVPPNLVGVDDNRPQPDFQAASTGQIVQNPNAPEGWGNDPTTGKMVKISDYNAGGDSGWYDEVTGDSTPVGVGTPRPTETQQQAPSSATYLPNEEALQNARVELGGLGIDPSEWNKYISSPDASGKVFYTKPASTQKPDINAGITTPPASSSDTTITPTNLAPEASLPLPTATPGQDPGILSDANAGIKTTEQQLASMTPPETETNQEIDTLQDKISGILGDVEGTSKSADLLTKEGELGLPQMRQDLSALNAQMLAKTAQYEQLYATIEGKPITMNSIIGATAQAKKMAQSEIGLMNAQMMGLQGNINNAQSEAARAIDAKWDTYETTLNIYESQLAMLQNEVNKKDSMFSAAEQRTYNEQIAAKQQMLLDQKNALAEDKQVDNNIQSISLMVLANTGDRKLADAVAGAKSELDAMTIAGKLATSEGWTYVATPAERDALIAQGYETTQANGRTYARQGGGADSDIVNAYVSQIKSGELKLTNVPAEYRSDVTVALGSYTAPTGGGGDNTKPLTPEEEMNAQLKLVVGNDGFISPDDYTTARKAWIDAGFSPTTFDTKFRGYRNPNNPNYVTNKQSSSSSGGQTP